MKLIWNWINILILVTTSHNLFADDGVVHLPKVVRTSVKKVQESIVKIENFGGLLDSSIKEAGGVKKKISGFAKPGEGPTTGVIVSSDGYIITSTFNFLLDHKIITVTLDDGRKFHAELMGKDITRKICILKIKEDVKDLPVPNFIGMNDVKVGQWAVSVGNGFGGNKNSISIGIISGKNRMLGKAIQTDANISPANYGGPLLDIDGNVIGICTPMSPTKSNTMAGVEWYDSGIGFVVSVKDNKNIIERLKKDVLIQGGMLGIHIYVNPKKPKIVLVDLVMPGSFAEKSGMKSGDQLISINGDIIDSQQKLQKVLKRFEVGTIVNCKVKRNEKEFVLPIKLLTRKELMKIQE